MIENLIPPEIEILQPAWAKTGFVLPAYKLARLDINGKRHYFTEVNGEIKFYKSVTTVLKELYVKGEELGKWETRMAIMFQNPGASLELALEAADYGTLMHTLIAEFVSDGLFNLDNIESRCYQFLMQTGRPLFLLQSWAKKLRKDMLSFAQWVIDYEVEFHALEVCLKSDRFKMAGALDMVGTLNDKKYSEATPKEKRKRVFAVVDFKSGGIHDTYGPQLEIYRQMWIENFPDQPKPERIYNWAPKEWQKAPTYEFVNQDDEEMVAELRHSLAIHLLRATKAPMPSILKISGMLNLGGKVEDSYKYMSAAEYVKQ